MATRAASPLSLEEFPPLRPNPTFLDALTVLQTNPEEGENLLRRLILSGALFPYDRFKAYLECVKLELKKPDEERDLDKTNQDLEDASSLLRYPGFPADKTFWAQGEIHRYLAHICIKRGNFLAVLVHYSHESSLANEQFALDAIQFFKQCIQDSKNLEESQESPSPYQAFLESRPEMKDPLDLCKIALQSHPESILLLFTRANLYFWRGEWLLAKNDYRFVIIRYHQTIPDSPSTIHERIADCFMQMKHYRKAIPHFQEASQLDRNPKRLMDLSAKILKAQSALQSAPPPSLEMAYSYIDRDPKTAVTLFLAILHHSPENALARIGCARAHTQLKEFRNAEENLTHVINPRSLLIEKAIALKYLGIALELQGNQKQAKEHFVDAEKHFTGWWTGSLQNNRKIEDSFALEYISFLRKQIKNFAKAYFICNEARNQRILPLPLALYLKACISNEWGIASKQGRWKELEQTCLEFFPIAQKIDPHYLEMLLFAIEAYRNLQQYGEALHRMKQLDELNPPPDYLVRRLPELREMRQKIIESNNLCNNLELLPASNGQRIDYLTSFLEQELYQTLFPNHLIPQVNALFMRGDSYLLLGHPSDASKDYQIIYKIIEKFPDLFQSSSLSKVTTRINYTRTKIESKKLFQEIKENFEEEDPNDGDFPPEKGIKIKPLIRILSYPLDP